MNFLSTSTKMINSLELRIFLLIFFSISIFQKKASAQEKPNIIFILTDDMGYGDISSFGGKFVKTPNIDRIAEGGIKFTKYYSASPICSPSRVSLLTGMYPARWNFTNFLNNKKANRAAEQANFLNPEAPSIAKFLKDGGYTTGHFGKWHMGGGRDVTDAPGFKQYGFDEHVSTYESPDPDPLITATDWIWSPKDSIKRWDRTQYFVNKTLEFLQKNKGKPCFVNLWPDDVHTPWVPNIGEAYTGKFPMNPEEEQAFKLVLQEFDKQVGRLLDGLKEMGLEENTIVIFTSDNGPLPSFRGSRSGGLRGTKLSLYEGGTRMPFLVKWPKKIPKGETDSISVLNSTDMLPTLASFAGIKFPRNYAGDGEDESKVLLGKSTKRTKDMYWEYGRNATAFNYPKGRDKSPNLAIRSGKWKLLINHDGTKDELYNLDIDRNETENVSKNHPKIRELLKVKLLKWWSALPKLD